jgi:nucleotide-binding universal stress UspA family protein
MTVQTMLLRLQNAIGQDSLGTQMLLQPGLEAFRIAPKNSNTMNLVIGYNGSSKSQTALDFALWMAHQTRLATNKQVIVHVVYVLEETSTLSLASPPAPAIASVSSQLPQTQSSNRAMSAVCNRQRPANTVTITRPEVNYSLSRLEQADRLLWQARSLAEEWRGSLEAHLGCGDIATELRRVVELQQADLLILGCSSAKHPLIKQLTARFPCPVLGIPAEL